MKSEREYRNPVETMEALGLQADHVRFDPSMRRGAYSIVREQSTDSTLALTLQMFGEALGGIAARTAYCKRDAVEWDRLVRIEYVVGPMRHARVIGLVQLRAGRYPGLRERIRIPVRPRYIYADGPVHVYADPGRGR